MQEPGINSIATWLMENNRHAIMIVPQCPTDKTWQGTIQDVLVALIRTYIDQGTVAADRVYILGGSMGGNRHMGYTFESSRTVCCGHARSREPDWAECGSCGQRASSHRDGYSRPNLENSNVETFLAEMDSYSAEYNYVKSVVYADGTIVSRKWLCKLRFGVCVRIASITASPTRAKFARA